MAQGGSEPGRGQGMAEGRASALPFSFVVVLKPRSGQVLISGAPIGTHEISIDDARALYDGLREALVLTPAIARSLIAEGGRR